MLSFTFRYLVSTWLNFVDVFFSKDFPQKQSAARLLGLHQKDTSQFSRVPTSKRADNMSTKRKKGRVLLLAKTYIGSTHISEITPKKNLNVIEETTLFKTLDIVQKRTVIYLRDKKQR